MDWFEVAQVGLLPAVVGMLFFGKKRRDPLLSLWSKIAKRRDGVVRERGHLDVEVGGVEVVVRAKLPSQCDACVLVDTLSRGHLKKSDYTRVRASFCVPAGPKFSVTPRGSSAPLVEILDGPELHVVAAEDFNRAFHFHTDDPDKMSLGLSPYRAHKIMVERFSEGSLWSDGEVVELRYRGLPTSIEEVEDALDMVGEVVGFDEWGSLVRDTLPRGRYTPPGGEFGNRRAPTVTVDSLVPVTLSPIVKDGKVFTSAAAENTETADDLEVIIDWAGKLEVLTGRLPDDAAGAASGVGGGRLLRTGGTTTFTWEEEDCECAADWLNAGVALVSLVASGQSRTAYR